MTAADIDVSSARPHDPKWIRQFRSRMRVTEHKLLREEAKTRVFQAGILSIVAAAKKVPDLHEPLQLLEQSLSHLTSCIIPWWAPTDDAAEMQRAEDIWRHVYGDPEDPRVKREIQRQIDWLNRMHEDA